MGFPVYMILWTKTFENCIPKEYFGWEITPALTSTPCAVEKIHWEPHVAYDIVTLAKALADSGDLFHINDIGAQMTRILKYKGKTTPRMPNPNPGRIRYAQNCNVYPKGKKKDKTEQNQKEKGPKK